MTKLTTSTKLTATILGLLAAVALALSTTAQGPRGSADAGHGQPGVRQSSARRNCRGSRSVQCPSLRTDAADWAGADGATAARLRADGFVMGIRESLHANGEDASVTSSVEHFRTRGGASAEMTQEVALALAPNSAAVPDERGLHVYRFSTRTRRRRARGLHDRSQRVPAQADRSRWRAIRRSWRQGCSRRPGTSITASAASTNSLLTTVRHS